MNGSSTRQKGRVRIIRAGTVTPAALRTDSGPAIGRNAWAETGAPGTKRVLNTGAGAASTHLHPAFSSGWSEVRLDIDPRVRPDIVSPIQNMKAAIPDKSFDAIWCSHNLEHILTHEVVPTLMEFRRVLKDDGFVFITCPDLKAIAEFIVLHGATATAYVSPAGPITPIDMLYGHSRSIAGGNINMCHNTGFTPDSLGFAATQAGFAETRVAQGEGFSIWALLFMRDVDKAKVAQDLCNTPERFLLEA